MDRLHRSLVVGCAVLGGLLWSGVGAALAADYQVTTTADDGPGSLRQAIIAANTLTPGADRITFNITSPSSGVRTIALLSALPEITEPLVVDGTTQPGYAGAPLIELNGGSAPPAGTVGLRLTGGSSTVRGLIVNRFGGHGILLATRGNNVVSGNYIGTNPDGTQDFGNGGDGIRLENSPANTIGGTDSDERNLIAGNSGHGISILQSSTDNRIVGNLIGTQLDGLGRLDNDGDGVRIDLGDGVAGHNRIGDVGPAAGNVIAFNGRIELIGQSGVYVRSGTANAILGNSVHTNGGLGIDLHPRGPQSVDSGDADPGANDLQNHPIVTSVSAFGGSTRVQGTLSGSPNTGFRVELFGSPSCDPSGRGEGQTFLGSVTATTNEGGVAAFVATLPVSLPPQQFVTATATAALGSPDFGGTSEFSGCQNGLQAPFEVTSIADGGDSNLADGVCTDGSGACTLRAAIEQVNALASGAGVIHFDLPGPGPHRVAPTVPLPVIAAQVTIDGLTQPGATPGTPAIELAGGGAGVGLEVVGGGTTIRGLAINGFEVGVLLRGGGGNVVESNVIGVDPSGTLARGNGSHGVLIDGSSGNRVGGAAAGAGNRVAFNGGDGVAVVGIAVGNAILGNAIFSNNGLALDLGDDGPTANDAGDGDSGPNGRQNFPLLASAVAGPSGITVQGTLRSTPNTELRIEFFAAAACDSSGFGEADRLLGSIMVETDPSGEGGFTFLAPNALAAGQVVVASATDPIGNTSELSVCREVHGPADLAVTQHAAPDPAVVGHALTYTLVVTNHGPGPARNVVVTDVLPGGVTLVGIESSLGSCAGSESLQCSLANLAAGASATITVSVTPTAVGTLTNVVAVSADESDPDPSTNQQTLLTPVRSPPSADLAVSLVDEPDPVFVHGAVTYRAVVTNHGPDEASAVVLSINLPPGVTLGSATSSRGACDGSGPLTCPLGALANQATATALIAVTPAAVGGLVAEASVAGAVADPNPANNTDSETTAVDAPGADLSVMLADEPDPIEPGRQLLYTIVAANTGPRPATAVVLSVVLPTGISPGFITASQGSCGGTGPLACDLGALAVGAEATLRVTVTPNAAGTLVTHAEVAAAEPDPNSANNSAAAVTSVDAPLAGADLGLTMSAEPERVVAGGSLTYTLDVRNDGPAPASGVTVVDTLPPGVALESSSATAGSCTGPTCSLGALAVGASVRVTMLVRPVSAGSVTNLAAVTAVEVDPNPANNAASATTTVDAPPACAAPVIEIKKPKVGPQKKRAVKFKAKVGRKGCPVESRRWDFGDPATPADTSTLLMTTYTYPAAGSYTATFTVIDRGGRTIVRSRTITVP